MISCRMVPQKSRVSSLAVCVRCRFHWIRGWDGWMKFSSHLKAVYLLVLCCQLMTGNYSYLHRIYVWHSALALAEFPQVPCEQRFLSCMAFSVIEVVRVAAARRVNDYSFDIYF